jgi:hypothetical protein
MMEDLEQTVVCMDDDARTPGDDTSQFDLELTEGRYVAWRTNAWLGNPGGIGRFLTKRGYAFFAKERGCAGMGGHYLVQQAFNKLVKLEDLSVKEVRFSSQTMLHLSRYNKK